ncbi:glycosyl transferase family 2 [Candidatus Daviesbacteria bacterium RIFCSPHIGHO2_02_FULL_41_14]|uniref:Glycosyl transferase family 2 n=1 Tax=Candidatus Daviesbacteria bacterium RIFCSPLOWO2_01_FULL_40_24 TaxID=1797787 RepID=A0A1F5MJF8_9BACT|nr:MAG: glycosyl transferase family 2 [Candidatus Daviesbacteria bacterium RIFCSPHIGHO2_02_FULL_41_14]OGE65469.1 MAG: glycosyl transferase family 2 [Candidatus Daviesbacteria bacterium RIFCSPLOWO2_01_FULL_40_24]
MKSTESNIKSLSRNWQLPTFKVKEFRSKRTKYCILIPVINEGSKIQKQLIRMRRYSRLADIIICDGGSTDASMNIKFLKSQGVRTLLIKTSIGRQGTQLRMGCSYSLKQGYEGIIVLDGNNKDGVSAIPKFINALDEGFDYVQGSRFIKGGYHENTPPLRYWAIRLMHAPLLSLAAGKWYSDTTNGFRALSRKYLLDKQVDPFRNIFIKYEFFFYLTARANQLGFKTKELPVTRRYPKGEIPTKIKGFYGNLDMLITVFKVLFRYYHPVSKL